MCDCQDPACRCHRFEGKVAIVTGAASGIGRACALRFARERARLALCDINEDGLAETCRLAGEGGAEVITARADVRSQADVEGFVAATLQR